MNPIRSFATALSLLMLPAALLAADPAPVEISGRYPHLAMWNTQGECGVGAVVPWADRLWVITYAPHKPNGSDDKLYEITDDLAVTIRPESIGGTPANRMIHRESEQLFIGPYVIDAKRNIRVIPYDKALGRPTANARHLSDPAGRIYLYTMEEGLYDIDVKTLDVVTIMKDGHDKGWVDPNPGYHGKGGYSAQGRVVISNNGEKGINYKLKPYGPSGALAEWQGPGSEWHVVERAQFVEVTGPGGIYGNASTDDPLWATGWDKRSVMVKLLDGQKWSTYRLPVADFSYVASHGWYTEWPRIREVVPASSGSPAKALANVHGSWWDFPLSFATGHTGGLKPIGSYLKITGDFTAWNGRIVFGCDDTAITGGNGIAGQSHSNLWFTTWDGLREVGRPVGWGCAWRDEDVKADTPSDPYLFGGYDRRVLHLSHKASEPITFTVEVDKAGDGSWEKLDTIEVPAGEYVWHAFTDDAPGQWVRLRVSGDAKGVTGSFHYGVSAGSVTDREMFEAVADIDEPAPYSTGIMRPRGGNLKTFQILASAVDAEGKVTGTGYYEMGADLKLKAVDDPDSVKYMESNAAVKSRGYEIDVASVIVSDHNGRFRLPRGSKAYDAKPATGWPRAIREVVTERTLLNAHGTIFVNPDADSIGFRGLKPVTTHNKRIGDMASYLGLLVLSGVDLATTGSKHHLVSDDGKASLWVGDVDDLWKLGKPRGFGGPWLDSTAKAGEPSDPYLMTGYDKKTLTLSHDSDKPVTFTVEVDVDNSGTFVEYAKLTVKPGEKFVHEFPDTYSANWVRFVSDTGCKATAQLVYE